MTEASEDLDFLGDSSMKDLAMRMGEIDKQLDEIAEVEKQSSSPKKIQDPMATFEDSRASIVSDVVNDGDDEGLASLQGELKEFEAAQEEANASPPPSLATTAEEIAISATVLKPSATSSIGISMKTIKGVTKIVAIAEKGLLASTTLQPGYKLVQINGVNIKNAKHARYIIQNAQGKVTIVTHVVAEE